MSDWIVEWNAILSTLATIDIYFECDKLALEFKSKLELLVASFYFGQPVYFDYSKSIGYKTKKRDWRWLHHGQIDRNKKKRNGKAKRQKAKREKGKGKRKKAKGDGINLMNDLGLSVTPLDGSADMAAVGCLLR